MVTNKETRVEAASTKFWVMGVGVSGYGGA